MTQMTLSYARMQAAQGIERVTQKAEKKYPGWLDLGFAYVEFYVQGLKPGAEFTAEMLVEASVAHGIIQPHDDRAWSGPIRRAAKAGLIEKHPTKTGTCRKRHASVCVLWRKSK